MICDEAPHNAGRLRIESAGVRAINPALQGCYSNSRKGGKQSFAALNNNGCFRQIGPTRPLNRA